MQNFSFGLERLIRLLAKGRLNGLVVTDQVDNRQDPGVIGYVMCQVRAQARAKGFEVAATNRVFVAAKPHQEESPERAKMSDGGCFPTMRHPALIGEYSTQILGALTWVWRVHLPGVPQAKPDGDSAGESHCCSREERIAGCRNRPCPGQVQDNDCARYELFSAGVSGDRHPRSFAKEWLKPLQDLVRIRCGAASLTSTVTGEQARSDGARSAVLPHDFMLLKIPH
jgi:hypothetical protein